MKRRMNYKKHSYLISSVSVVILVLVAVIGVRFFYTSIFTIQENLLLKDIQKLKNIFDRIEQEAGIVSFKHDKNYIDFLNVEKFSGSEVGPLKVHHPEKWHGPYLKEELTFKTEPFMVVRTATGYYIIPGEGIRLSNGKVIGKDIVITAKTDMEKMMRDPQGLSYKGKPLAVKLEIENPSEEVAAAFEELGGD